jgi:hypothetical protein
MQYIIGVIVVLFGLFIYNKNKKDILQALLDNVGIKKKLLDIDSKSSKLDAAEDVEEERRSSGKAELTKELNENKSAKELEDFFNGK